MTGIAAERKVTAYLRAENYLVGSLRHIEGPGDLIALPVFTRVQKPLLVEVKATGRVPWDAGNFGPTERGAMLLAGDVWGAEPMLAWLPPGLGGIVWLPDEDWPSVAMSRYPDDVGADQPDAPLVLERESLEP